MYLADATKSNNEEMTVPPTERDEMLVLGSGEGVVRRKTLPVTLFELRAA